MQRATRVPLVLSALAPAHRAHQYVTSDSDFSAAYSHYCELLKGGGKEPPALSDENAKLWRKASAAKSTAAAKQLNADYVEMGGQYAMLVDGKLPRVRLTDAWLEYLNYRDFGVVPAFQTHFCCVSKPHLFNSYFCVCGLTGSLGGKAEKAFLTEVYSARAFKVPLFLDTCRGHGKEPAVCIEVSLHPDRPAQRAAIVRTALEARARVPVLIITRDNQGGLEGVYDELERAFLIGSPGDAAGGTEGGGEPAALAPAADRPSPVQVFAQLDPKHGRRSMKHEWGAIVERATKRLADGSYPVTVTDPWGGRGYDFRCLDDAVNEHGGLLLIVTSVPQEREWTQWKGRTARQDRRGQFAVMMCQEDPPFAKGSVTGVLPGIEQQDTLIETLLEEADKANFKKIEENRKGLDTGRHLAEVCDKYYRKYRRETHEWPAPEWREKDRILRDQLLQKGRSLTVREIEAGARKLGLNLSFGGPMA